jgi:MFS superfamily sulfate permease-like transporter
MFTVKADVQKNRLYVTFQGFFNFIEMKECTDKTIEECKKLKPGYDVITDISQFKIVGQDATGEVARAQAHFKKSGVRHAIRVVGNSALANSQFTRIGKTVDYVPQTVATPAEAEKILDAQPVGLR